MFFTRFILAIALLGILTGCASYSVPEDAIRQEALEKAVQEIPESQLLDVWIELFDPGEIPEDEEDARGLTTEIRAAEARYIPSHLRRVMEKTGFWGAVRVVPRDTEGFEILVGGVIKSSDGEMLKLAITAKDATGHLWFSRTYHGVADSDQYLDNYTDRFEAVYHAIANDLTELRSELSEKDVRTIRDISEMRFAADMLPEAFGEHLSTDEKGNFKLERLPANDDPSYERVRIIRERDFLLIDTMNDYYDNFHAELEIPYQEWRKARTIEAEALREVKKKANNRKILGALAILGAIAIEVTGSQETRQASRTARDVMVVGGMYAIKSGIDINAQSVIHQGAIEELGESFASEAQPLVVQVEGETLELKGSAEDQYRQWRDLMRKIYASETGFGTTTDLELGPEPEAEVEPEVSPDQESQTLDSSG
jgi:hypothetical protein